MTNFSNTMTIEGNIQIVYQDNHLLIVSKPAGLLVQGDQTGDSTLIEFVKKYLKVKFNKPNRVFLGLPHRIDRPTSGLVVLAKTSKALSRVSDQFKTRVVKKWYLAIIPKGIEQKSRHLIHYLKRVHRLNRSFVCNSEDPKAKRAVSVCEVIDESTKYQLLKIRLITGRHHQIRAQLAAVGFPIKGDLKYGSPRSNSDASICLHASQIEFVHPTTREIIQVNSPHPETGAWKLFASG